MRNVWLIARREYLERIRAKSFIIMTILIPALMGGIMFGGSMLSRDGRSSHIAVVSDDAQFGLDLQSELEGRKQPVLVDVYTPSSSTRETVDNALGSKGLDGYLWVTPASAANVQANFQWVPRARQGGISKATISEAVRTVLTREALAHSGMGTSDVKAITQSVELDTSQAAKDNVLSASDIAYALFFLMYFVILFYGMNVARSIIEEKTSRIFEVLLATIRPEELMAGKVLGVGAVGLTQVGIWLLAALIYTASGIAASGVTFHLTFAQVFFFVLFFILGFLLYSSLAAALGAMTSSEQELQQMNIFLMLPLITCSIIIFRVVSDPNALISKVFSFIPFCTPLIMYVRIAVQQPPWYEIAIAIAEMLVTIYVVIWIASRIYRVGVLMYGKRPNLPEILRWLKYS